MNLYISGSNRKNNSYEVLKDLMNENDKLISLEDLSINFCMGCGACSDKLPEHCVIEDDMEVIYKSMIASDKIIIMSPIYMNHITGILKNMIDRLNPFYSHGLLKGKKLYILTVGQVDEEENEDIAEDIKKYFEGISEFFHFDVTYLRNFSSGKTDNVKENYDNYDEIIKELREKIEE